MSFSAWREFEASRDGLGVDVSQALCRVDQGIKAGRLSLATEQGINQVVDLVATLLCARRDDDDDFPEEKFVGKTMETLLFESQHDLWCEHVYGVILHPGASSVDEALIIRYNSNTFALDGRDETCDVEVRAADFHRLIADKAEAGLFRQRAIPPKRRLGCDDSDSARGPKRPRLGVGCASS